MSAINKVNCYKVVLFVVRPAAVFHYAYLFQHVSQISGETVHAICQQKKYMYFQNNLHTNSSLFMRFD
jgi:hypothetical protein